MFISYDLVVNPKFLLLKSPCWLVKQSQFFWWFLHTRYVSQFCLYLGIDVAAEPDLITEVDDYLKRPLPEGSGDSAVDSWTGRLVYATPELGVTGRI